MTDTIIVADRDVSSARWVSTLLEREGYLVETVTSGQDLLLRSQQQLPRLIILENDLADGDGLGVCRRLRELADPSRLPILMFSRQSEPQQIVSAMQAGADDYVIKRPGADVELVPKVKQWVARAAPPVPAAPAPINGQLILFFSPKGGTGTTTICVNTAHALATGQPQARVLVVDMVLPLGTVNQFVGYHSEKTLAQLTREAQTGVDPDLVARYVGDKGKYGLYVLLNTNDYHEARVLDPNQLAPLFEQMLKMFDYVLVDIGRSLSDLTTPLLKRSDLIVMILNSDINTVTLGSQSMKFLHEAGIQDARVFVINNRSVPRIWISKEETEAKVGAPVRTVIPYDEEQMPMAVNQGVPYMAKFGFTATGLQIQDMTRQLVQRLKTMPPR